MMKAHNYSNQKVCAIENKKQKHYKAEKLIFI